MDGAFFDRITKTFADRGRRRDAFKAIAGAGVIAAGLAIDSDDVRAGRKRKHCRKIGQRCGGKKTCCNKSGLVRCEEFPADLCQNSGKSAGTRCCGQAGARCDPKFGTPLADPEFSPNAGGNCSCCDPLFCGKQPNGKFRCQIEST